MSVVLSEHLPLLASAPDGIQKLRGLILELAVSGKLVPQDPNDEPASELLKRIAQERVLLDAAATRRKSKESSTERNDSQRFDLPSGWECAPLGEVVEIVRGITFPSNEKSKSPEPGRVLCLRTSNVQDKIEWDDVLYIRSEFISRNDQYLIENDIVMSMANSRELVGKVALVDIPLAEQVTFGGFLGVLRPISISPKFLMAFLRAPTVRSSLIDSASQTTNIANISLGKLRPLKFPIPPVAEQHRIVAKVDEMMTLCDRLKEEQADAASAHARLVETLLGTLTQSTDSEDLASNWQRLAEHFDTLFSTEASIDVLKQTVLQLAVMGKLIPQDPNDEPASALLNQLTKRRVLLEADGTYKKSKMAPLARTAVQPSGWTSASLPELCGIGGGATPSKAKSAYWDDGLPWVSPKDMKVDQIFDAQDHVTELALRETRLPRIPTGSLLVVVRGMILAHSFPVATTQVDVAINQDMKSLTPFIPELQPFLALALKGWKPQILALVDRSTHGTCKLQSEKLFGFEFGIPPLAEQHRIVAKVDKLMALCDSLKADLATARQHQATLADTLIESAQETA